MPGDAPLRDAFWYAGIALEVVLLLRLLGLGLARRYPFLTAYLGFSAAQSLVLLFLARSRAVVGAYGGTFAYGWLYLAARPVLWAFYFLIILELYSRMTEEYPGLRRFGRLVSFGTLAGVALICCLLVAADGPSGLDPDPFLAYLVQQERAVFVGLSVLLLALVFFVAVYPIVIPRNVWLLTACLGGYVVANAALLILRQHFGAAFIPWRNLLNPAFFFVALLGATLFFSRAGETGVPATGTVFPARDPAIESALALQLQSVNQLLVRVLRQ